VDGFLRTFSLSFAEKEMLEIGAYDGATAYALAEAGAKHVLATDMAAYYITQSPNGVVCEGAIATKNADLARLRDAYSRSIDKQTAQRVSFLEDDICSSSLRSESVEAVMSWEVLEHLTRPEDAFRQIARILKPGGFAFHEYNPFFSMNGGHSLCTLDFLWGHARLQAADFEKYLEEIRPSEKSVALSFYRNNLNRMTLSELEHYVQQSGLSLLSLLPQWMKNHLTLVRSESLSQCNRVYPSAELIDLISPTVWVLLRKKDE
jgi:SAM-dependent methyltransferase